MTGERIVDMKLISKIACLIYHMEEWGTDQEVKRLSFTAGGAIQDVIKKGTASSEREKIYDALLQLYSIMIKKDISEFENYSALGFDQPTSYYPGHVYIEEINRLKDVMFFIQECKDGGEASDNMLFRGVEEVEACLVYRIACNLPEFHSV